MDNLKVTVKFLDEMVKRLKKDKLTEVNFEFLVGSCFPNALENIKTELRRQYTLGYTAGLKENQNEAQNHNTDTDLVLDSSNL